MRETRERNLTPDELAFLDEIYRLHADEWFSEWVAHMEESFS